MSQGVDEMLKQWTIANSLEINTLRHQLRFKAAVVDDVGVAVLVYQRDCKSQL